MRVLIFAYACEPDKGSEPGAGWVWSRMLARLGDVWVITRESNKSALEHVLGHTPERASMHFEYVDLPQWARFWKRGVRGARLYYLLWQVAALRRARRLRHEKKFELTWHLTWANAWLGTLASMLEGRFVYGPVGGGMGMDWRLVGVVGFRGAVYEIGRALARGGARYLNPLARLAWRRADLILTQNPETIAWLPRAHRGKAHVFPHIVLDERTRAPAQHRVEHNNRQALFVGRLLGWKGVSLCLRTIALLPEWRLIVAGSGYDERRLRRLSRRLRVSDRVDFLGWVPASRLADLMRESDVLLFPSIHDEGGWVIAEALASGLPVVCLDRGGPPVLGGTGVTPSTVPGTARALSRAVVAADRRAVGRFPTISDSTDRLGTLLRARFPTLESAIEANGGSRGKR